MWTLNKNIEKRISAFENKWYWEIFWVSWTEHRSTTNRSIAVVKSGTLLKRQNKLFRTCKRNQPLKKLILEGKVQFQRNRGRPKILWEWCGHIVVDLTVESRTNSRRSADVGPIEDPSRQQRPEMDKRKEDVYHHCKPLCLQFSARTSVSRDKRLAA